ncbi:hypothetical protein JAAARDRAFT_41747 [Jaapia argillacea MUCL 33604]|uniref:GDP-fucose protein O-fucosyltransferase 2 n=1 Tax=Jaapia argillacea MUCL 33604 TaxID=933084 RepID=A0A067PAD7_9AGAM|nr:hypothetical protein JAAARDRAFT_41747 [Jaapia argillacea MUCL 33604]
MKPWKSALRRLLEPRRSNSFSARSEEDYALLPSTTLDSRSAVRDADNKRRRSIARSCLQMITLRRLIFALVSMPMFLAVMVLLSGVPPSYEDVRAFERRLPQHSPELGVREKNEGMYLRFGGQLWGHGLNNILQEIIMMSHLAYLSNRSYVFEDYTWSRLPFPYTIYDFALRPTHIPINAFISGPSAGGPLESHRAVSVEHWDAVCPRSKRRIISIADAPTSATADGKAVMEWWVNRLSEVKEACVEIDQDSLHRPMFDKFFFGSSRILSLWPSLSTSPILTDFAWSPLVQSAVTRNFALLQPYSAKLISDPSSTGTLPGLVAVHLRRGDFERHCPRLSGWESSYMGFNEFPTLPDRFDPFTNFTNPEAQLDYYMEHCLPTVEQIVERLRKVRAEHGGLKRVYLLTNAWGWWLNGLKEALSKDGWDDATSSLDVLLDSEQQYVGMAVDMAIAGKAEVFVGNGFSSLSSNVVMLRMARGLDASSNRFL